MLEAIVFLVFVVLDQLTKLWAAGALVTQYGGSLPVIEGVFHFTYVENRGAAFSLLQNQRWLFIVLTVAVSALIVAVLLKKRRSFAVLTRLSLTLLLSGAVGNLIDRIALGYVRDMLDFCLINFPVFNVADCCVTIGAILLVAAVLTDKSLLALFEGKKKPEEGKAAPKGEDGAEGAPTAPEEQADAPLQQAGERNGPSAAEGGAQAPGQAPGAEDAPGPAQSEGAKEHAGQTPAADGPAQGA